MSKDISSSEKELDLFELFEVIWGGKWLIIVVTFCGIVCGGTVALIKPPQYTSTLNFSVNVVPPFYSSTEIKKDFHKTFLLNTVFVEWKKNNANNPMDYKDFSETIVIDGIVLTTPHFRRNAVFKITEKPVNSITLKTEQLSILNGFYKYASYVNDILTKKYVQTAEDELQSVKQHFQDSFDADSESLNYVVRITRFIDDVRNGMQLISIDRPTVPVNSSFRTPVILAIFALLGLFIGVFSVLLRHAIRRRKVKSAEV